jgi:hypothetical protein
MTVSTLYVGTVFCYIKGMKNDSILCHLGAPRTAKPASLAEYGKLRESIILSPWAYLPEIDFIKAVTEKGQPFYSCLFTRDLMELGQEKLCWRQQVFAGADFDSVDVPVLDMVKRFSGMGLTPHFSYHTFSHNPASGLHNYRLVWKTETDLSLTYDQTFSALKKIRELSGNLSDGKATSVSRMWQGSNSGVVTYAPEAELLDLRKLASNV